MKYIYTLLTIAILALGVSCSDDFTTVNPVGSLSDTALANATGVDLLLTGAYSVLDGVRNGGNLSQNFRTLKVMGLLKDMPDAVKIDITPLKIGEKIRVLDLNIPGLKFSDPENAVVVGVLTARAVIEEEEEEEEESAEGAEGTEGADSEKKNSEEPKKDE